MVQQHAQFEEESRGEPSYQIGYAPHDELPPLSSDQIDLPGQKLQAGSPGTARSTIPNLARQRFVLALISLIFVFVLMVLAMTVPNDSVNSTNVFFVVLFAVLAIFLNLIFAFRGNASPQSASKPDETTITL
jgi:hypothetical protein